MQTYLCALGAPLLQRLRHLLSSFQNHFWLFLYWWEEEYPEMIFINFFDGVKPTISFPTAMTFLSGTKIAVHVCKSTSENKLLSCLISAGVQPYFSDSD